MASTQAALRGGGAADAETGTDGFDGAGGVVVELEVGLLGGAADPEVDVGLVPDLEVPLRDLVKAIALNQVLGEGGNEGVPLGVVGRRGDDLLVPEGVVGQLRGERHWA